MMQFLEQQALQSLGGLVLGGANSGLRQQPRRIDLGLRQQVAQRRIFGFERVFLGTIGHDLSPQPALPAREAAPAGRQEALTP